MVKKAKQHFTPGRVGSFHVKIEAVYALENCREMEDTLDQLRQYGYAVVVSQQPIADDFYTACAILQTREMKR